MGSIITGIFALDWAILTVSLFNTIIMLWLGMTILLNANRRHWGVWLLGGGTLMGAAFFISHTAILGQQALLNLDGLNFWWRLGWIPVTIAPFAWYIAMLWYGGFWNTPRPKLRQRHFHWFTLLCILTLSFVILLLTTSSIPAYENMIRQDLSGALTVGGLPLLLLIFPLFMIGCIALAIDVLLHTRFTDDPARQRSRPWLLGASGILLVVSLLVGLFVAQVIGVVPGIAQSAVDIQLIGWFDLVLSALIAAATLLMGQAVVSFEVFTGNPLPRDNFFRHWRNIVLLAAGYGAVVSWTLAIQLRPVYSLLLTTLLMVLFYALYSWRTFVERERFMARLRPFVTTQNLVAHFLSDAGDPNFQAAALFHAICRDILNASRARLIPLGSLVALAGKGLHYPPGDSALTLQPPTTLDKAIMPLSPDANDGYCWAVPLWTERGLIGALMLGAKQGGGVYTQDEIDIAQTGSERVIDMLASEKMARSLVELQRQRIAQTRILDLTARRTLHDQVLPSIHTAILDLSAPAKQQPGIANAMQTLTDAHRQIANLIRDIPAVPVTETAPLDIPNALHRLIDREFSTVFSSIQWQGTLALSAEPLVSEVILGAVRELVRNAAVHGRGGDSGRALNLTITLADEPDFVIRVRDDGVGLSQSQASVSGSGLALHSTLLALINGQLSIQSHEDGGTCAEIRLPRTLFQSEKL